MCPWLVTCFFFFRLFEFERWGEVDRPESGVDVFFFKSVCCPRKEVAADRKLDLSGDTVPPVRTEVTSSHSTIGSVAALTI